MIRLVFRICLALPCYERLDDAKKHDKDAKRGNEHEYQVIEQIDDQCIEGKEDEARKQHEKATALLVAPISFKKEEGKERKGQDDGELGIGE